MSFTTDKNGYYWYQMFVNGSSYQPSQYAWFYADDNLCVQNKSHFKRADEIQCSNATYLMTSPPAMTTTFPINVTMDLMSTTAPKMTEMGSIPIYYIIGALTVFIILFTTLAIVILIMFICKRHRKHRQKIGESFAYQSVVDLLDIMVIIIIRTI